MATRTAARKAPTLGSQRAATLGGSVPWPPRWGSALLLSTPRFGPFTMLTTISAWAPASFRITPSCCPRLFAAYRVLWPPAWLSPALLILWAPAGFRVTLLLPQAYYRGLLSRSTGFRGGRAQRPRLPGRDSIVLVPEPASVFPVFGVRLFDNSRDRRRLQQHVAGRFWSQRRHADFDSQRRAARRVYVSVIHCGTWWVATSTASPAWCWKVGGTDFGRVSRFSIAIT